MHLPNTSPKAPNFNGSFWTGASYGRGPTRGLSAKKSRQLLHALRKSAREGQSVITLILQWDDNDFGPIAREIETVLQSIGWIVL